MTKILFLHGNAGTHRDATPLREHLTTKGITLDDFSAPDLYQPIALHQLLAGKDWTVVAHSWGCYRLLQQIPEIEHHLKKIILVNPYLQTEKPLSMAARTALSVPLVGVHLLKSNHHKQKDQFLRNMLAPANLDQVPYASELQKQLNASELWILAAQNKIKQQQEPLNKEDDIDIPTVALIGEQDQVCNNELQVTVLKELIPNVTVKTFTAAGHGMIWTHLEEISKELSI
jgi:pimeloyl-ACP methyl ester carboxylesterase